jgi:hypothetical protein
MSVICLLVLFPASALSQRPTVTAGCGTATIDGAAWPGEWANAGKVDLFTVVDQIEVDAPFADWEVRGSQADEVTGELWVMHNATHFFLATILDMDSAEFNPNWWVSFMFVLFADEPGAPPGHWAAPDCGPPLPGEGWVWAYVDVMTPYTEDWFMPDSEAGPCDTEPLRGVQYEVAPGSVVWEYAFDLNSSELDNVGPGDCFDLGLWMWADGCEKGTGCWNGGTWLHGEARWPESFSFTPDTFGEICLDPCEVEFVPEPGSIVLLGSGLTGLAGYATLRWRTRE